MAKIFYGVAGEGIGHASRALSVIDYMPEHQFHVFTFGKAYNFLKTLNYPYLHKINGIMFSYHNHHVDYFKTTYNLYKYFKNDLQENIEFIKAKYDIEKPSLFITDFEPSIPRFANQINKKFVSIDNQHRFSECELSDLPLFLRVYCKLSGEFVKKLVPDPHKIIISTFNHEKLTCKNNVVLTNGLLRKGMDCITPSDMGHALVYVRDSISDIILDSIYDIKLPCFIYGAKSSEIKNILCEKDNFKFYGLSSLFIKHLVSCKCLISTAGNQLITEARFYNKPILSIPEPMQYEQYVNAHYVEQLHIGKQCSARSLNSKIVNDFVNNFESAKSNAVNGVNIVIAEINNML